MPALYSIEQVCEAEVFLADSGVLAKRAVGVSPITNPKTNLIFLSSPRGFFPLVTDKYWFNVFSVKEQLNFFVQVHLLISCLSLTKNHPSL